MESELKSSGNEVVRVVAAPASVKFSDLPREILVRLVGSKMRVVRGVCRSLHALVNENKTTLVLKAMVDSEELDTMNVPFVFSILRSPRCKITGVVAAHAIEKIKHDNDEACGGEDWNNFFHTKTLSDLENDQSIVYHGLFERFALAYDFHNPNGTRIDTVYDLLMRFDDNIMVVVESIRIFSNAFLLKSFVNHPSVDIRKYIFMLDKIVVGANLRDEFLSCEISRFVALFASMSKRKIRSYPLGYFEGVSEMMPRLLLALLNEHGTVQRICQNVLTACMQLAYTNHFMVDMTRLELVDKAFRVVLMHPNDVNVVVFGLKFFGAMTNYAMHKELEVEGVLLDVIHRCQEQARNVPGLETFLRAARVNPQFATVHGDINIALLMCFASDDV